MGFGIKSITKAVKKVGGGMMGLGTGALVGGLKGGIKGAIKGGAGGFLPAGMADSMSSGIPPPSVRAPTAPYKPIEVPDYNSDMQRYYQMTNHSVPTVQRMNPGMIQRGGYQGPTFANDRGPVSLQQYNQRLPVRGGGGGGDMWTAAAGAVMQPQQSRNTVPYRGGGGVANGRPVMTGGMTRAPMLFGNRPRFGVAPGGVNTGVMGPRPLMVR